MEYKEIQATTLKNAAGMAFKNSIDLLYEGELLYKMQSYGHSASFAILGIEELGKALGYKLLYRFKIIPIQGRIQFDPNKLLKDLQSQHKAKQSIAVMFSALSQFSSNELQELKKELDTETNKISYSPQERRFDNFLEITESFSTIRKWQSEIDKISDYDKLKQSGFYVEIMDNQVINIPKKIRAKNVHQALNALRKMIDYFRQSVF